MSKYQGFLVGKQLTYKKFVTSPERDHEHCNMCGLKFSDNPEDAHYGYATDDDLGWVCQECYEFYKEEYQWNAKK